MTCLPPSLSHSLSPCRPAPKRRPQAGCLPRGAQPGIRRSLGFALALLAGLAGPLAAQDRPAANAATNAATDPATGPATNPATGPAPQDGIAMYGSPALPDGFTALPYARPDAPQGGTITLGEAESFDSLNPWILKGRAPALISNYVTQSLMMRSLDEPFTLYGLLAQSVETPPDRAWVEFTLRPEARFSDGKPVTVEDVIWSYETLGKQGHPRYAAAWAQVKDITSPGPGRVRITFNTPDRELAMLMGLRPVLEKAQWAGRDFTQSSMMVPVGSGPYVIAAVDPGRSITLKKTPDWWAKDLPATRGFYNFDTMRFEFYTDLNVMFEAFKAGAIDVWRETNAARWQRDYGFAAVTSGRVAREEIPNRRPSGITGLVFNTRQPIFADWRVREALTLAFNFDFINRTLNLGVEPRITSWFANSDLAARPGPASGRVAALLAPFRDSLAPGTLEGYTPPVSDGTPYDRANMRQAMKLLAEAGWRVQDGQLRNAEGAPFRFEILLSQGQGEAGQVVDIYAQSLARLGIHPTISVVDAAQYVQRTNTYDFGMAWYIRALSLSPGNEQRYYWGHDGITTPGSRNWMGMNSPAAEAMIDHMLATDDPAEFTAAVQALDRVLSAGRWVIPAWFPPVTRIAHASRLHHPETLPLYGDWPGFLPDVWWTEQ